MVSTSVVEIISLRRHGDRKAFVRLACLSGYAHVRLLNGDLVGCAQKDNVSIPHLVNWRTKDIYPLSDFADVYVSSTALREHSSKLTAYMRRALSSP